MKGSQGGSIGALYRAVFSCCGLSLWGSEPIQLTLSSIPIAAVLRGAGEVAAVLPPNGCRAGPGRAGSAGDEAGGGEAAGEQGDV